jgi:hypothetical protein
MTLALIRPIQSLRRQILLLPLGLSGAFRPPKQHFPLYDNLAPPDDQLNRPNLDSDWLIQAESWITNSMQPIDFGQG